MKINATDVAIAPITSATSTIVSTLFLSLQVEDERKHLTVQRSCQHFELTWRYCATAAAVAYTSAGIGRCSFHVIAIGFSPECWT